MVLWYPVGTRMIIFYYTLHDHFFSGVSLLVQDSEIAESQGIASPKQDDTSARVSDHLQAPQDARRRASTGSSPISEAGSTGTLDSVGQLGFSQQSVQSNGTCMHSYYILKCEKCYKMWKLSSWVTGSYCLIEWSSKSLFLRKLWCCVSQTEYCQIRFCQLL